MGRSGQRHAEGLCSDHGQVRMKAEMNALVLRALTGIVPILNLRGVDALARDGGDLDYMVPVGEAIGACRLVADAALAEGWFLTDFRNIMYLAQIVLIRPGNSGLDQSVKLDFFDGIRWYAVGEDVAGQQLFNTLMPLQGNVSRLAGAAGFFQKILVVGRVSERDWRRVAATGADLNYLANTAQSLCLPITLSEIERRGVTGLRKWRLRAASCGSAAGATSSGIWLLQAAVAHVRFRAGLGTCAGMLIGVSGLDGSGKTTLVDRLIAAIRSASGEPPTVVHLLPAWIPLPHQIFRRTKTRGNYTRPYAEPPVSSWVNGWLRLTFYLCAFALARLAFWLGVTRGRIVILDRSFLDFGSDLTRSRIPARRLPTWLLHALMPKGQIFYLNASPKEVVARKGELTMEKACSLKISYLEIGKALGVTLLNGDSGPDDVFRELLGHISLEYLRRIRDAEGRK